MRQFNSLSAYDLLVSRAVFPRTLFTVLTVAIAVLLSAMAPAIAQQSETSEGETAGSGSAAELLETDGQDPSISLPAAPNSSQIRQEEQSIDQQEQQELPTDQETRGREEQQLQQQEIQQTDTGITVPGTGSNPEQDSPDGIQIPF